MWLFRLVVIVAIIVAVWYVVRAVRAGGGPSGLLGSGDVTFTPVEELQDNDRRVIDAALAQGSLDPAVAHYRAATGAGTKEARAALDTYRWKQGGAPQS